MTTAIQSNGAKVGSRANLATYFEKYFTSVSTEAFDQDGYRNVYDTEASQQGDRNSDMNGAIHTAMSFGNGGAEMVLSPVIFGLLGFVLDGAFGLRPILTIVGVLVGLGGAVANQYFRYTERMTQLDAERKAAHVAEHGTGAGPSFGAVEATELPSYVLASDVDRDRESELA